ncbi:MAG: DUF5110 domain-containing protein, partial [candidate division KSB1 bacterium]|nr:DUF5110 domain-containing protein [candidate division KSB1 bacterium]
AVYLPECNGWYDFWTGEFFKGGQTIEKAAPIDIMPLYVKAGSIIPMGPFKQYSSEKPEDPIELRIYPGADAVFVLYEDENDNYNYEKGIYATIPILWNEKTQTLTIGRRKGEFPGMLQQREFRIIWVKARHGIGIELCVESDQNVLYSGQQIVIKKR